MVTAIATVIGFDTLYNIVYTFLSDMTNSYVAELRDVTMQFEDKLVLDDLSLKIQRRIVLSFSGRAAAAKS